MKTLLFLRHAKSSWSSPGLSDHDRPLNGRGRKAAKAMGRYIESHGLLPDLILCSTARRARETLEHASAGWSRIPHIRFEGALYDFSGRAGYLDQVHRADEDARTIMLIGHNPTTELLVTSLMADSTSEAAEKLANKYPTAALAQLTFAVSAWSHIAQGQGNLVRFTVPRELTSNIED